MRNSAIFIVWLLAVTVAFAQEKAAVPAGHTAAEAALGTSQPPATTPTSAIKVATRRARLPASGQSAAPARVKLLDESGKPVTVAPSSTGALEAEITPGKSYLLLPTEFGRQTMRKERLEFPGRYLTFDKNGNPANDGGLFLHPLAVPLVWNDQTKAYSTEVTVGYDFKDGHEQALASPKTVTFFAEGSNARIQADTVVIKRSGTSGYERVMLSTNQLDGETLFTARASSVDELKASVAVYREPGSLEISVPSRQIDAFGLGTESLTITLLARDGSPLAAAEALTIHLTSQRLRLPASTILRTGQSTTAVGLRSIGYGDDEIRADVGALRSSLSIQLVFPIAAVLAAVIGGGLGGSARFLRNKGKRKTLLARRLVEGILVGVLFVGAAWVGLVTVDVGAGILSTPFGAFVLAGLSGYVGCAVLDRVAERTFRGLKPEQPAA